MLLVTTSGSSRVSKRNGRTSARPCRLQDGMCWRHEACETVSPVAAVPLYCWMWKAPRSAAWINCDFCVDPVNRSIHGNKLSEYVTTAWGLFCKNIQICRQLSTSLPERATLLLRTEVSGSGQEERRLKTNTAISKFQIFKVGPDRASNQKQAVEEFPSWLSGNEPS